VKSAAASAGRRRARAPFPSVAFPPDFVQRVESLVVRLDAARERSEGAGANVLLGAGEEFVGYRPYRAGEDLRTLDWSLYARLDRPYVRVTRREVAESWTIALDTSASMATGPPGKLQRAAETTCALACLAWKRGASVRVVASGPGADSAWLGRGVHDLAGLVRFLCGLEADAARGLETLLGEWSPEREAGRVFVIGDLLDLAGDELLRIDRRSRELFLVQFLSPIELDPTTVEHVDWLDPETNEHLRVELDTATRELYAQRLARELEEWGERARRHGWHYGLWSSATPFEEVVHRLLDPLE